jgi:hypothetical protein
MEVFDMSNESTLTPGQAVGTAPGSDPVPDQSATTPAGEGNESASQEGVKGEFLTRAEAEAMIALGKQEAIAAAYTRVDQSEKRAKTAVQEVRKAVEVSNAAGHQIAPEVAKQMEQTAVQKAMTEPEPAPAGQAPQAEPQGQVDPNILEIQKDKGIELFDGDPELALIDRTKSQLKFYKSVEAACEAKKARLASAPKEPIQPISPAARVPAGGGPSSPERTGRDYLQEAHKQTNHT